MTEDRRQSQASGITDSKGFTLIELAIVLVIIGIIMGAVLKGQDLIEGARLKKFVSNVKQWEVATWAYLDKTDRFPGDSAKNGIIGDGTEDPKTDLTGSGLTIAPGSNQITAGGNVFYVYLGNEGLAGGGKRNVLVICKDDTDCSTTFSEEYKYGEALDNSFDNADGGTLGSIRGTNATITTVTSGQWEVNSAVAITPAAFTSATKAILYYFDKRPS